MLSVYNYHLGQGKVNEMWEEITIKSYLKEFHLWLIGIGSHIALHWLQAIT